MSLVIFEIVYGAHRSLEQSKKLTKQEKQAIDTLRVLADEEQVSDDGPGTYIPYSGQTEDIAWVGIRLGEFAEDEVHDVSTLQMAPTDEQKKAAEKYIQNLPEDVRAILSPISTWFIPSST